MSASQPASPKMPPGNAPGSRRLRMVRLMVGLLVLAAFGPCLYVETPREVARWYLAAAYEERARDREEYSYELLARAVAWSPRDAALYLERAQWHDADGEFEKALDDYRRADELAPNHFRILFARSLLLQKMGRHEEALADWKAIDKISETRGLSTQELRSALAAIQEDREAGRKQQADERLKLLIGWSHDARELRLARIAWQMEDKDFEAALAGCNELVEEQGEDYPLLALRSQVLQHLGRHEEAIADWEKIDRLSKDEGTPPRSQALNGLAYARAVGNLKIEKGLAEVNEALKSDPNVAAYLDTRGYLLYRQGKYEAALKDMDPAVEGMEADYRQLQASEDRGLSQLAGLPSTDEAKSGVAVVRYHRALVLEKLGRKEEAEKDLARARELIGREPDETLF